MTTHRYDPEQNIVTGPKAFMPEAAGPLQAAASFLAPGDTHPTTEYLPQISHMLRTDKSEGATGTQVPL
ncbi:hypothetical protein N7463_001380 [Penicillium fimorum]|uniref:Uncharacterized protein n=1 Tax=Penicillium fimorum TaxID=1882269 RepID=A0A9W9Y8I4_9EURO|nr:hypothetical protein N7463_001380 [Penicillium fimorum]